MNNSAFSFQSLNPDVLYEAIQLAGLQPDSGLTELNSYENRVWSFTARDAQRYIIKFYRPHRWNSDQLREEHAFCCELAAQQIPVVAPLRLQNDETLFHLQDYYYAIYPSIAARQYEMDNLDQLEQTGYFLGALHRAGERTLFRARPSLEPAADLAMAQHILTESTLIPAALKDEFLSATEHVIEKIKAVWSTDWQPRRLHGDLHAGNLLWRDGPIFVDQDDSRNGPAIQDIWMLLSGSRQEQQLQLDCLLAGYEAHREFDRRELRLIEPLRAMRMVTYIAWILRRWADPAFPKNFPWIKEEEYWRQQIANLRAQIQALDEPPLQLGPGV